MENLRAISILNNYLKREKDDLLLYLDDNVYINKIRDDEYGALHRVYEEFKDFISISATCLYIENPVIEDFTLFSKEFLAKSKFVLNNFAADNPVNSTHIFLVAPDNSLEVKDYRVLSHLEIALEEKHFQIKDNINRDYLSNLYKIVDLCCKKSPGLSIALERFNSCLIRTDLREKIIDATIALEHIVPNYTEISFRLALYNSFLVAATKEERYEAFKLLKKLYDVRSKIIHGAMTKESYKNYAEVEDKWNEIIKYIQSILLYFMIFIAEKSYKEWDQHLQRLIFGLDGRIVD